MSQINVSNLTEFQTYDVDIIQINDDNIQSELYLDYFKNNISLKKEKVIKITFSNFKSI